MTPHELNAEISRRARAEEKYQELFQELVHHPQASWTDWVRCMDATDEEVQRKAWQLLSEAGFPQWSLSWILGMPRTPEWLLPLVVSEVLSRYPDNDLALCLLLHSTERQNDRQFFRVVSVVVKRQSLTNYFDYICQPLPSRIQEAVGDLLICRNTAA